MKLEIYQLHYLRPKNNNSKAFDSDSSACFLTITAKHVLVTCLIAIPTSQIWQQLNRSSLFYIILTHLFLNTHPIRQ